MKKNKLKTSAMVLLLAILFPTLAVADEGDANPGRPHIMPMRYPGSMTTTAAPSGSKLIYYGGRVVSNMEVVQVLWGSGNYLPEITSTGTPSIASFYSGVLNSAHIDWLSEYNTDVKAQDGSAGTQQKIGRGGFVGQVTITPSSSSKTVDDTTIQKELANQIAAGHLPTPSTDSAGNSNTYYAVFFPHGVTITESNQASCQAFCAYHGTVAKSSKVGEFYYGVHPDFQAGSGCDLGCGSSSKTFNNVTSVAAHEMIETITDPEVGLAANLAAPLAWYDNTNGEIGDICNGEQGTVVGSDGVTYTVQTEFSNTTKSCIVSRPATVDFDIQSVTPTANSVSQGQSANYIVATINKSSNTQSISLSVRGLPSGVTATFSQNPIAAGASSTLTLSASSTAAPVTSSAFTIVATGPSSTHNVQATISVLGTSVPDDSAPVFTSANNAIFKASSANTFTVTATGTPSPTFSTAGDLPAGVTLSARGVLSGTPVADSGGTYRFTIVARNGSLPDARQDFVLTVQDFSVFITPSTQTIRRGESATYALSLHSTGGLTGTAYVSCSGGPSGSRCQIVPDSTGAASAHAILSTSSRASRGTYRVTIKSYMGAMVRYAYGTVTIR